MFKPLFATVIFFALWKYSLGKEATQDFDSKDLSKSLPINRESDMFRSVYIGLNAQIADLKLEISNFPDKSGSSQFLLEAYELQRLMTDIQNTILSLPPQVGHQKITNIDKKYKSLVAKWEEFKSSKPTTSPLTTTTPAAWIPSKLKLADLLDQLINLQFKIIRYPASNLDKQPFLNFLKDLQSNINNLLNNLQFLDSFKAAQKITHIEQAIDQLENIWNEFTLKGQTTTVAPSPIYNNSTCSEYEKIIEQLLDKLRSDLSSPLSYIQGDLDQFKLQLNIIIAYLEGTPITTTPTPLPMDLSLQISKILDSWDPILASLKVNILIFPGDKIVGDDLLNKCNALAWLLSQLRFGLPVTTLKQVNDALLSIQALTQSLSDAISLFKDGQIALLQPCPANLGLCQSQLNLTSAELAKLKLENIALSTNLNSTKIALQQCEVQSNYPYFYVPEVPAKTAICNRASEVRDGKGNYIKTACEIDIAQTYDSAASKCSSKGMQLFRINDVHDLNTIQAHSNAVYPSGSLWIYGRDGVNCKKFYRAAGSSFQQTLISCSASYFFFCEFKGIPG